MASLTDGHMISRLFAFSGRITERNVLWGLILGFGLVVILLGLAGLVAVRDSRAIRQSATKLAKDQVLIARLLHEVQAQEDALALGLHRLTRDSTTEDRANRLKGLELADKALANLAQQAGGTPQAEMWNRLASATQAFTQIATPTIARSGPIPENVLESLFTSHDGVVRIIHDLVLISTQHLTEVDEQMNRQLRDLADDSTVLLSTCFFLAALFAVATIAFVRKSIRRIEWQRDELSRVSWHMLQTQEETARRFSHELHDELGQSLAAVRANLTSKNNDEPEARKADCVHLVDEAIANVRELSQLLRPVILDDFGLDAGLRWLTEKFGQRVRVKVDYESSLAGRLHSDSETHLFRIAQEALTNIARHSEATRVNITLQAEVAIVRLVIADNGKGIQPDRQESSSNLGLIGMRARARECGGTLEPQAVMPNGLRIVAEVPLRLAESE
jgi:signal transduction histidine kinase